MNDKPQTTIFGFPDERVSNWSLKLDVEPDSPINCKYMSHAVSLLHSEDVEIVNRG